MPCLKVIGVNKLICFKHLETGENGMNGKDAQLLVEKDNKKELGYVKAQQAAAKKERPVQLMDHRTLTQEYATNAHVRVRKILMWNFEQYSN